MIVVALAVFLISGVAALLYQVIWQRILVMFTGADVYASTIIVAAFMAGLGVGNLVGGHVADRSSRRTALMLVAGAELAVAAFSVFSRPLYYDLLYRRLGPLALPAPLTAGLLFTSLLWPTFFMGVSLPLLARALTERIEHAASTVGALYGVNTLGAAAGACLTTWWILPRVGLDAGLMVGVLLNVTCAVLVLPLVPRLARLPSAPQPPAGVAVASALARVEPPAPFLAWVAMAALSGFLALSLEIVWFRLLGVMVKSTAFTFGTLLAVYLTGMSMGALAGSALAPRLARPARVFLGLQAGVGLSAAGLLAFLVGSVDNVAWLHTYFARYDSLDVRASLGALRALAASPDAATSAPVATPGLFVALYVALPAALIIPPTFMMGLSFPVLQRVVQTDLARLGRRVGVLLLANISGSVVGVVLTGWVLLDTLGTAGTLTVLAAFSSLFAVVGVVLHVRAPSTASGGKTPVPWAGAATTGLALLLLVMTMPDAATLWTRLHGTHPDSAVFGEDASGLSVLRLEQGLASRATVFVNGLGQSTIPYGDVHTALGMLPAFLHPDPRDAAIIGLGSGDTVYGVAGRVELERIVSIEIIRPQIDTLRRYARRQPYGGVVGLLDDPRIEHVSGDGRIFLMRAGRQFDIIEADALRPTSAYSGNLYSEEYFTLVRDRLRPNGLAATWSPTVRVHNAFVRVFPYVVSVPGILLGSPSPIGIDREAIAARIADPRARAHYARAGIDVDRLVRDYLASPTRYTPDFDRSTLTDFNTDLFAKDEFDLGPLPPSAHP